MIDFFVVATGSLSIAVAAIITLIRFSKIHRSYRPFVYIVVASLINELISITLIKFHHSNAINTNLLSLAEGVLWSWQLAKWKAFNTKTQYHLTLTILITAWIAENIVLGKLFTFSSGYAIVYSLVMVLLSINQVNRQIVEEKASLLTSPKFLICSGSIIFNTYRIIVECFYLLESGESGTFLANIYAILVVVNVFVNLLFALAALWIPTKQKFSLPYSSLPPSSA